MACRRRQTGAYSVSSGTPASNGYQVPFKFTGKLTKLTLNINRPKLTPEDIQKLKAAGRNNRASE
jgi:hypothetical protein